MASSHPPPALRSLRHWGIGGPVTFIPVAEGLMNPCWRADAAGGSYFLKQVVDVGRPEIAFQHRVTTALARAGLPVPVPIADGTGRRLVEAGRGRFTLYPWVRGRHRGGLDLAPAECRDLGGLLGRLHRWLGAVTPPVQQALTSPATRPEDALTLIDGLLARIPRRGGDFDRLARAGLRERRGAIRRLAGRRPPTGAALTTGYVHGDFHALNVLYGPDGSVAAVLDWDRLGVAPFARELVRAGTLFFDHRDERGLDLDRVIAFAGGYLEEFPLDRAEIRAAEHRLWWDRLCGLWMLQRHYCRQDHSRDHLFAGTAALIEWWTANRNAVSAAFAAA